MLEIKHTLCPSCSVGCGINVVSHDGDVVGTHSYKRHQINEGKNCLNGRNSIEIYKNRLELVRIEKDKEMISKLKRKGLMSAPKKQAKPKDQLRTSCLRKFIKTF